MGAMQGRIEDLESLDARQFVIEMRKLADSLTYGIDRSPFVGSGLEFAQSRPYQAGDTVRMIDWRVTARTRRFHVKEYESPKSMPCYLLLDTSASMAVSSRGRGKYHTMLYIAGGLALACLDRVSPVGVVGVGQRVLRVRPSLSQARVLQWLLALRTYRYDEATCLAARIGELSPTLTQRSLVIVLSDLHEPGALPAIQHLAQRHDCVVLRLVDPSEKGLAGAGFFRAREAETGREFVTRGKRLLPEEERLARELQRGGIDQLTIRTDQPFEPALRQLFRARGWIGKGAR